MFPHLPKPTPPLHPRLGQVRREASCPESLWHLQIPLSSPEQRLSLRPDHGFPCLLPFGDPGLCLSSFPGSLQPEAFSGFIQKAVPRLCLPLLCCAAGGGSLPCSRGKLIFLNLFACLPLAPPFAGWVTVGRPLHPASRVGGTVPARSAGTLRGLRGKDPQRGRGDTACSAGEGRVRPGIQYVLSNCSCIVAALPPPSLGGGEAGRRGAVRAEDHPHP